MVPIRVTDHEHTESLCDFLLCVSANVQRTTDPHVVLATLPGALSETHERRELANYLETWRKLRSGCAVELLGDRS